MARGEDLNRVFVFVYPCFLCGNITKACGISTKQESFQETKKLQENVHQKSNQTTNFHFEKKTVAHLVFRILLPVPEKGTM